MNPDVTHYIVPKKSSAWYMNSSDSCSWDFVEGWGIKKHWKWGKYGMWQWVYAPENGKWIRWKGCDRIRVEGMRWM